jgi:hypothetical protein
MDRADAIRLLQALADAGMDTRAPSRKTSVSRSVKVPGWTSWKTLVSVTAYHSFGGEVEALNTPRYAALPLHAVTNFRG